MKEFLFSIVFYLIKFLCVIASLSISFTAYSGSKNSDKFNRAIGQMIRVLDNGPGDKGSIPVESYQRLKNGTWCRLA